MYTPVAETFLEIMTLCVNEHNYTEYVPNIHVVYRKHFISHLSREKVVFAENDFSGAGALMHVT